MAVGTCLSGGLDSSAVVCVINQLIRQRGLHVVGMETRQKTFSARWADPRHDEGRFIDAVVDASDVDGRTIYPTAADLRAEWPRLFWHQEEPFGSTSIFAQWNVFKLAREAGVTVTLDGQGGDELLAGYLGFFPPHLADLATGLRWRQMRRELAAHGALHGVNTRWELRNVATNSLPTGLRARLKPRAVGGGAWLAPDFAAAAQADAGERWVVTRPGRTRLERSLAEALTFSPLPSLLRFDDRNSMAFSIESRVPFLDYRLIEFCCRPARRSEDPGRRDEVRPAAGDGWHHPGSGIVGLIHLDGAPVGAADMLAMADAIRHRGPDDVGYIIGNAATGDLAIFGGNGPPENVLGQRLPYAPAARLKPGTR